MLYRLQSNLLSTQKSLVLLVLLIILLLLLEQLVLLQQLQLLDLSQEFLGVLFAEMELHLHIVHFHLKQLELLILQE